MLSSGSDATEMRSGLLLSVLRCEIGAKFECCGGVLKVVPISVKDLLSLLKNTDLELYRETARIHSELRKVEHKTITSKRSKKTDRP